VAKPKPGIGRGLSAILSASPDAPTAPAETLHELPVDAIAPNPRQPRRTFDDEALEGLAASVAEQGVIQPVLVRPRGAGRYELVAGERRWRAARIAGLRTVPAIVRERADAASLETALVENMAREDLSPIEEARACAALSEELGLSRKEIGRRVGRSRVAISNLLRLLDLPDEVIALLDDGRLSEGHGRALLMAQDHGDRRRLARVALEQGLSVRALEERARESNADESPSRARPRPHPDQEQAAGEIADALGAALGTEVRVRTTRAGGYRAELLFSDQDEAIELARRIRPRAVA
jgi:ParB family chromosome partitioning protein